MPTPKGRPLSETHKEKIRRSLKNRKITWGDKISKSLTGKHISMEAKKKMSEIRMGKKLSEVTKGRMSLARIGSKNPNWKNGGVTSLVEQIRRCYKYRQWRSDVFTRDDFTCVLCERRGGDIEADHYPKEFSDIFYENQITSLEEALTCEELWNINNGRTLCKGCHGGTKKGRRRQKI